MSEERFDRIEQRLDRLESGQTETNRRLDGVEERLTGVEDRLGGVEGRLGELDRHMHLLHEQAMANLAAVADSVITMKREVAQGFANLQEVIGRRLDPLEVAVRQHSVEIERLKQGRA